ncbi:MAG: hypothetical protein E4G90_08875, partial [Gemmatimonadales bacterium]
MRSEDRKSGLGFTASVAISVAGVLLLLLVHQFVSGFLGGGIWRPREVLFELPGWIGLFLPFAAFVGGLAAHAVLSVGSMVKRAAMIAVVSYFLLAYGSPMAFYRDYASREADLTALYPFGPPTPRALLAQRSAVEANPPQTYSFRVGRPLEHPPNWLTYLLHRAIVIAGFSVLAGLLGHRSGKLTTGLSPPDRRNARWALGLASSIAFFLAEAAGGE